MFSIPLTWNSLLFIGSYGSQLLCSSYCIIFFLWHWLNILTFPSCLPTLIECCLPGGSSLHALDVSSWTLRCMSDPWVAFCEVRDAFLTSGQFFMGWVTNAIFAFEWTFESLGHIYWLPLVGSLSWVRSQMLLISGWPFRSLDMSAGWNPGLSFLRSFILFGSFVSFFSPVDSVPNQVSTWLNIVQFC